jgi:hypothetical protein
MIFNWIYDFVVEASKSMLVEISYKKLLILNLIDKLILNVN